MKTILSVLVCALLLPVTSFGDVAYVRAGAQPGGDGLSWATAKPGIRGGINVLLANEDVTEIWVAAGTYPCGGSPYLLPGGVQMYGGFTGVETEWSERDPYLNETILDARSQSGVLEDSGDWDFGEVIVDGFVITGGRATEGGGFNAYNASPIFVNCDFRGNVATGADGGAIRIYEGEGLFVNCDFRGNDAAGSGGAIDWYDCQATFVNCRFRNNKANGSGGAIAVYENGAHLINCTLFRNEIASDVGDGYNSGSAIMDYRGVCRLDNCIVWGNTGAVASSAYPFPQHGYYPSENTPYYNWSIVDWDQFNGVNTISVHPELDDSTERTVPKVFSPAIDSANADYLPADEFDLDRDGDYLEPVPLDCSGRPRFQDATVVEDTTPPNPLGSLPLDRGAFEFNDDCNGNGISDILDIQDGAPDCNGDLIPDECELDWDGDGVADICEILAGDEPDCNGNGILDVTDVARGDLDRDGNGVPDSCQPDCNGNDRPDTLDISVGFSVDCNDNEVPDECELITPEDAVYSIGDGSSEIFIAEDTAPTIIWLQGFEIEEGRETIGAVEYIMGLAAGGGVCSVGIWLDSNGDLDPSNAELLALTSSVIRWPANDIYTRAWFDEALTFSPGDIVFAGVVYDQQPGEYPVPLDQNTDSPDAWIAFGGTDPENLGEVGELGRIGDYNLPGCWQIRMIPGLPIENDCNANLRPDDCDIADGAADDDSDGIPDDCDDDSCLGDYDGSGAVDGADLTQLLGGWGTNNPALDLDGNGTIDGADLTVLLGAWGSCS